MCPITQLNLNKLIDIKLIKRRGYILTHCQNNQEEDEIEKSIRIMQKITRHADAGRHDDRICDWLFELRRSSVGRCSVGRR
jgi:hypothetical protein